jgi:hypothetical protein
MLCGRQSSLLFASEQLLSGTAIVSLGVAQVGALDKAKGTVPGLTGGISQLVTSRESTFAVLVLYRHHVGPAISPRRADSDAGDGMLLQH